MEKMHHFHLLVHVTIRQIYLWQCIDPNAFILISRANNEAEMAESLFQLHGFTSLALFL